MTETKFQEAIDKIRALTVTDRDHKSLGQLFIETNEELGEFCRAYSISSKAYGKAHKTLDEPPSHEAVDLLICAYAMQFFKDRCYTTRSLLDLWEASKLHDNLENTILDTIYLIGQSAQWVNESNHRLSAIVRLMDHMDDLATNSMALYRLSDGNREDLPGVMLKKLAKWENNQGIE